MDYYKKKHPFIISALRNIKTNKKMAHAYIVHCDNSELRNDFAKFTVKYFLCKNEDYDCIPCEKCSACTEINKNIYPDFHILSPTSKTRKIKIGSIEEEDTLRWFQNLFSLSTLTAGGSKAGIIYDADCLMPQAQNAFLKTLEEPTKKTFFILATENPELLLPTIRSRCQTISLLTNKFDYTFEGSSELFLLLYNLVFISNNSFTEIVDISEKINKLFAQLYMQAETKTLQNWDKKLKDSQELESKTAKDRIKEKYSAAVEAEYRQLRKYFLDGIFIWFAQLYQNTVGIKMDSLSNPEIFCKNQNFDNLSEKTSLKYLEKAQDFVKSFKLNINETLAIQEFCLSFFTENVINKGL
ncbi:MAG: hypothetical protein K9L78_03590 [Victivallales bacterium]|nr:hypothetical protein [Victivallales bacterium]